MPETEATSIPRSDAPAGPRHLSFVDALRGLAILGVVGTHVAMSTADFHGRWQIYASRGAFGVQLFFVVSAFTLFWSLRSRSTSDRKPVAAFFVRRVFRIVPLFWAATLFYLIWPDAWRIDEAPAGVGVYQIATTLLLIHGWSATTINGIVPGGWSIGAEAMFYLLIPMLFRRIKSLQSAMWLAVAAMAFVGLTTPFAETHLRSHYLAQWQARSHVIVPVTMEQARNRDAWIDQAYQLAWRAFPAQAPVFCMGFVLYFLLAPTVEGGGASPKNRAWFWIVSAACALFADVPDAVLSAVAFSALAYGLATHPVRPLVNRVTRFLGAISYSIYVWHFAVLQQIDRHFHAHGLVGFASLFLLTLTLAVPIAVGSYYLIEVPGQSVGKVVIRRFNLGATPR